MTSLDSKVGKLLRVPFPYAVYMSYDFLGTPSGRLIESDLVVLLNIDSRQTRYTSHSKYLILKILTSKGVIGLMNVSEAALRDYWKVAV